MHSSELKVAVTVWEDRISPVFDSARKLLIVSIAGGTVIERRLVHFDAQQVAQLIQLLKVEQVVALICGAVSSEPALLLESADFELIPFISGNIEDVLAMLMTDKPVWNSLKMPGCGKCCHGRNRQSNCPRGGVTFEELLDPQK